MSLTTFGFFEGAIKLAEILNKYEDAKMANKVCSAISDFDNTLRALKSVDNKRVMKRICYLWEAEAKDIIEKLQFPEEVKSFALNVESTIFKKFVRSEFFFKKFVRS